MLSDKKKGLLLEMLEIELKLVNGWKFQFGNEGTKHYKFAQIIPPNNFSIFYTIIVNDSGLYVLTLSEFDNNWVEKVKHEPSDMQGLKSLFQDWYGIIDKE